MSLPQSIAATSSVQFGKIGVGTPPVAFTNVYNTAPITGGINAQAFYLNSTIMSDITGTAILSTQAASFTLSSLIHFRAAQGSIGAGSAINNQMGYFVNSTLIGAMNNYGFFRDIPSGTGRWNLYMNGTANNYLNGNTLIGTTTNNGSKLQVSGSATISGNVGIGISSPAEKLSVNGKIRAQEIKVETSGWPDYVFESDYKLPDLKETEQFIKRTNIFLKYLLLRK